MIHLIIVCRTVITPAHRIQEKREPTAIMGLRPEQYIREYVQGLIAGIILIMVLVNSAKSSVNGYEPAPLKESSAQEEKLHASGQRKKTKVKVSSVVRAIASRLVYVLTQTRVERSEFLAG